MNLLKKIFNNSKDNTIDNNLFKETYKNISDGINEGYGTIDYNSNDPLMVLQLKQNIAVFSAFKSHSQQSKFHDLLLDEKGQKRSWSDFQKMASKIDDKYNQQWLSSEYNLAIRQARSAKQWQEFEAKKDIYPNLQYMPSRSADQRDIHKSYYNKIWSIDDPIWNNIMPPNGWGCKCWVQQTREDATENSDIIPIQPIPGIAGNSGKSGTIFTATHPYIVQTSKADKLEIKKELNVLRQQSVEVLKIPIGKNNLLLNTLADQNDVKSNIDFISPFIKKYKIDFGINSHSNAKGIKNPELIFKNIYGDLTHYSGENIKNFTSRGFRKLSAGNQLGNQKKCFLGFDFNAKIDEENIFSIASQFNSKLDKYRDMVSFILLKNGDKISKINNGKKLNTKVILDQMKKELL